MYRIKIKTALRGWLNLAPGRCYWAERKLDLYGDHFWYVPDLGVAVPRYAVMIVNQKRGTQCI
jgi:hypothetical protein